MKRKTLAIGVYFFFSSFLHFAICQDTLLVRSALNQKREADSALSESYLFKAREFLTLQKPDSAVGYLNRSISIASDGGYYNVAGNGYELLASVYDSRDSWEMTLSNYLKAAEAYRKIKSRNEEARVLNMIANIYFRDEIYKKAGLYYEQEYLLCEKQNYGRLASSSEMAGMSFYNLPLDSLSSVWYEVSAACYESAGNDSGLLRCNEKLAVLYTRRGIYDRALNEYDKLIASYTKTNNYRKLAATFNQAGFLKFRMNDINGALAGFTEAIEFSDKGGSDEYFLTDAWSNKAICFQNLENEKEMLACFRKALGYAKSSGRNDEAARIERIMAMIYFRKGDNYHAEIYCQSCIGSAKTSGNFEVLQLCYRDYSDVLESGNDFIRALEYYEKYLNLRDSLNYEKRMAEKEKEDKIAEYEVIEQRVKDNLASEEIEGLELKNLKAESLRRENEINLLLKQQELAVSEKERLADSLALEKERFELNRRKQDIISLENRREIDSLTLYQKNIEADALVTKNQLLETEKKQQEENAKKARQIRNMAVGLGVLMGLVAIMILSGLISTRKKNRKLAESKRHIEKINTDLEQTNAEVLKQKEIIEQKNQSITDSIQYASRIQTAVLPPVNFLDEFGISNFILFKPKDIVSGDFYWGVKKNDRVIIAAADCTGHGVPGAFMSMLGHAFLEEIVNTREPENAAAILNILRDEIITTLKQKGSEGETRDGMDISLVVMDLSAGKLDYAGANNPLYMVRDNGIIKYEADRMPIGIHVISLTPFTNRNIEIKKGDLIYLSSDGYADQFGGPRGKKLMYKPFQDLLLKNSSRVMEQQKELLDRHFEDWKGNREQVDDVLVIGVRI